MKQNLKIKALILTLLCFLNCEEIIEVQDISEETIIVLAPMDTSVLTATNINFSWGSIQDAEQYKLQIATPSFEEANQVVLDTTIIATGFNQILSSGDYQWRVRAENSDYQTVFTTQSFSIEE